MSNKNFSKLNYEVVGNDYDDYDNYGYDNDDEEFYDEEDQEEYYPEEIEVSLPAEEEIVYAEETTRDSWDDEITTTTPTLTERADNKANTTPKCEVAPKSEVAPKDISAKLTELLAWCEFMGISIEEIPGTFEDKYEEMVWNKSEEKKVVHKIAIREEAERAERAAKGAANLALLEKKKSSEGKKRAVEAAGPNAKGKLQGKVADISKKQRNASKAHKEKAKNRVVEVVQSKSCLIVPQIELISTGNVKSIVKAPAESIDVVAEVEEEEEEQVEIVIREQIVLEEKPSQIQEPKPTVAEVQKIMDDTIGFITVSNRKKAATKASNPHVNTSKITAAEVLSCLFIQGKNSVVPKAPVEVATKQVSEAKLVEVQDLTFTKMCNSVMSSKACFHGKNCRFAHSMEQLQKKPCAFPDRCRFAACTGEGVYKNKPCQKTGKICSFWHQNETNQSYADRLGFKIPKTQFKIEVQPKVEVKVQPKVEVKVQPKVEVEVNQPALVPNFVVKPVEVFITKATKLAPWAKLTVIARTREPVEVVQQPAVVESVQQPVVVVQQPAVVEPVQQSVAVPEPAPVPRIRKSRWGPEIQQPVAQPVVEQVQQSAPVPEPAPVPRIRKSRWGPEIQQPVVEQVVQPVVELSKDPEPVQQSEMSSEDLAKAMGKLWNEFHAEWTELCRQDEDRYSVPVPVLQQVQQPEEEFLEEEFLEEVLVLDEVVEEVLKPEIEKPIEKTAPSPAPSPIQDSDTVIIEIPRSMQELALKTCLSMGHKKFKIVLTD